MRKKTIDLFFCSGVQNTIKILILPMQPQNLCTTILSLWGKSSCQKCDNLL